MNTKTNTNTNTNTKDLTKTAMFIALIAVGAFLSFPLGAVSITLQTLFVMLAAILLPRRYSLLAIIAYLLLGIVGLPIFAGGVGGLAIFAKPNVGFLVGFIPLAWISSFARNKRKSEQTLFLLLGNIVLYSIGFIYMYWFFNFFVEKPMDVVRLLQIGVLPYLPGDAVKILIVLAFYDILKKSGKN